MSVAGEITLEDLARRLDERAAKLARLDCTVPLSRCRFLIDADIKRHFHEQTTPDGTASPPIRPRPDGTSHQLWRTGMLARSYSAGPGHVEQLTPTSLVYGSNAETAAIHHYGGTINAKSGKALAIPLTPEAMRAPGPRQFPRPLFRAGRALAERKGKGKRARLILHYALAASVKIPPRPRAGWSDRLAGACEAEFAGWLEGQVLP